MNRYRFFALALPLLLACKRPPTTTTEAGAPIITASTVASAQETSDGGIGVDDDEDQGGEGDGGCPIPVHPGYCRRNCRTFSVRNLTRHASRIRATSASGIGTCGSYQVFAENDSTAGDAGIIEFYDDAGALVAAEDHRVKNGCGRFGTIPTCTPTIHWAPPAMVKLGPVTATTGLPVEVIQRIMRQNTGRYRQCYDDGLAKDASLKGKLVLAFEVDKTGAVSGVRKGSGNEIAMDGVVQCAIRMTNALSFPVPDGGAKVTVTAEIDLALRTP